MRTAQSNPGAFPTLEGTSLGARFDELTRFLVSGGEIWRSRPFILDQLPWETEHGELAAWLRGLSEPEIDQLSQAVMAGSSLDLSPGTPRSLIRFQHESLALTALGEVDVAEVSATLLPRQGGTAGLRPA